MIIIVGLGNPGEKFKNTRHNVGFMAVDKFAEKNNFPEFKLQKKSNALISEETVGDEKIILVKPQTFMNESGKAVKKITTNYSLQTTNLIIIHDDIDLPVGKIKIVKERGSAGQKGVESIIKTIGNDGLIRFRIGTRPPKFSEGNFARVAAKDVVLKNFSAEEQKTIDEALKKTAEALDVLIASGLEKAMNQYNLKGSTR